MLGSLDSGKVLQFLNFRFSGACTLALDVYNCQQNFSSSFGSKWQSILRSYKHV